MMSVANADTVNHPIRRTMRVWSGQFAMSSRMNMVMMAIPTNSLHLSLDFESFTDEAGNATLACGETKDVREVKVGTRE